VSSLIGLRAAQVRRAKAGHDFAKISTICRCSFSRDLRRPEKAGAGGTQFMLPATGSTDKQARPWPA